MPLADIIGLRPPQFHDANMSIFDQFPPRASWNDRAARDSVVPYSSRHCGCRGIPCEGS